MDCVVFHYSYHLLRFCKGLLLIIFFHNLDKRRKKTGETKDAAAKLKKEEIKEASVKRAKLKEKQEALRMKRENKKKAKPVKKEIEGG